jgi:hypothetical protein
MKTQKQSYELDYSGCHIQKRFLLSPSTHSLHVSARAGHLQVIIFFSCEASYCPLTDPLFELSLRMLSFIINRYYVLVNFACSLVMILKW